MTRRDLGKKEFIPISEMPGQVVTSLRAMQKEMLARARASRDEHTFTVESYAELQSKLDDKGGFMVAAWCQSKECENRVKEETKATIRCLQLDAEYKPISESKKCIVCGELKNAVRVVFARSY